MIGSEKVTEKELIEANKIKAEIDELERFMFKAESVWEGKIISRFTKFIFKSIAYGAIESAEYNMNTEIKNRVLDVLREHLKELKKRLEDI